MTRELLCFPHDYRLTMITHEYEDWSCRLCGQPQSWPVWMGKRPPQQPPSQPVRPE